MPKQMNKNERQNELKKEEEEEEKNNIIHIRMRNTPCVCISIDWMLF